MNFCTELEYPIYKNLSDIELEELTKIIRTGNVNVTRLYLSELMLKFLYDHQTSEEMIILVIVNNFMDNKNRKKEELENKKTGSKKNHNIQRYSEQKNFQEI